MKYKFNVFLFLCNLILLISFKCGCVEGNNDEIKWNQSHKHEWQLQEKDDPVDYFKKNSELLDKATRVLSEKSSSKSQRSFFLQVCSDEYDSQE